MNEFLKLCFYTILIFNIALASSKTLTINGTGDSQELLTKLGEKFEKLNPSVTVIIPASIGSGGGIKKVIHGDNNLGRTARALKKDEKSQGVKQIVFAYSPVVFVVNYDAERINFTVKNIMDIFSGKIKRFEDIADCTVRGKIYVIRREPGDSSLNILRDNLAGFKDIKEYVGKIAYTSGETKRLLLKYKNTISYVALPNIKNSKLKIINVDNTLPTKENILSGKYKLITPFGLVYKGKLQGIHKQFIDFLKTKEAKEIMQNSGVVSNF